MRDLTLNDWLNAVIVFGGTAAVLYAPWIWEAIR